MVSLTNMSHFLIIITGNKNFLDIAEHYIYFFGPNAWFSLYESQSPSYFICYNTTSPLYLGTVLQIDFDQLNSLFFSVQFQIWSKQATSLTIHLYLNRPPYDLQLDLGTVERNTKDFYIIFFQSLCMIYFNFFSIQVHFNACNPYHVERVEIIEYT